MAEQAFPAAGGKAEWNSCISASTWEERNARWWQGTRDGKILRRIAFPSGKDAHPDEFLPRFYEAIDALLREYNGVRGAGGRGCELRGPAGHAARGDPGAAEPAAVGRSAHLRAVVGAVWVPGIFAERRECLRHCGVAEFRRGARNKEYGVPHVWHRAGARG